MEDFSSLSTVIDTEAGPSAAGGGSPTPAEINPEPAKEPASLREDLEAVFKDEKKDAAKEPEPKAEPKPDPTPKKEEAEQKAEPKQEEPAKDDAKTAADPAEAKEGASAKEAKPEEGKEFRGPPKRFLPDSHEVWRNVPRSVRRDIETMEREHQAETERFTEVSQRYDRVRDFDELAQRNGRDLRESLAQVHQFENLMRENPVAALNMALLQVGPRKPDGQPFSLYEVAQHIAQQGPEGYQRMVAQPAQQQGQRQPDPQVEQLQTEIASMKAAQLARDIIEPFKAKNPRYEELQDDIAFFLKSGKIPQTLSHQDRLAAAYDMAVRINPASHATPANPDPGPGTQERRADPEDFSGSKSIKSSPGSVTEEVEDQAKSGESTRDSILKEMRRLNR